MNSVTTFFFEKTKEIIIDNIIANNNSYSDS